MWVCSVPQEVSEGLDSELERAIASDENGPLPSLLFMRNYGSHHRTRSISDATENFLCPNGDLARKRRVVETNSRSAGF